MPAFSLVELPANLSRETLDRLSDTRISGQLIELRPDAGRPQRRTDGDRKPYRDDRKPYRDDRGPKRSSFRDAGDRKPRHKRGDG